MSQPKRFFPRIFRAQTVARLTLASLVALSLCHSVTFSAFAVDFPTSGPPVETGLRPLSNYGQIQNVQSYSSNPFWNPSSPYNQRMPVPVYAQGTALSAADCRAAVSSVVAMQCAARKNCSGLRLDDVRPGILQTLASLPGNNYVTACGGFVDEVFAAYMAQNQNLAGAAAFPTSFPGMGGGAASGNKEFKVENPYPYQLTTFQKNWLGRANELSGLQAQNADSTALVATQMPKTFDNLTFAERNQILAAGYAQWQCDPKTGKNCAYVIPHFETDSEALVRETQDAVNRQAKVAAETAAATAQVNAEAAIAKAKNQALKDSDLAAWCAAYPIECETERDVYKNDMCVNGADTLAKGQTIQFKDKYDNNAVRTLTRADCDLLKASATIRAKEQAIKEKAAADAKAAADKKAAADLDKLFNTNGKAWCEQVGNDKCQAAIMLERAQCCTKWENADYLLATKPEDLKCVSKIIEDINNTGKDFKGKDILPDLTKEQCLIAMGKTTPDQYRQDEDARKAAAEEQKKVDQAALDQCKLDLQAAIDKADINGIDIGNEAKTDINAITTNEDCQIHLSVVNRLVQKEDNKGQKVQKETTRLNSCINYLSSKIPKSAINKESPPSPFDQLFELNHDSCQSILDNFVKPETKNNSDCVYLINNKIEFQFGIDVKPNAYGIIVTIWQWGTSCNFKYDGSNWSLK
ncbi:MAG: hypothetical protein FWC61_03360 [Proteobacteria bacterium]|nr:hypothetical protein [Pseudomonadota bacterium]